MPRIVAAILVLCLSAELDAQHRESITVSVVEVPIYVERFGKAVTDLTKDDFELFVNGERHAIDSFDVLRGDEPEVVEPAAAPAPRPLDQRRLFLLLFNGGGARARKMAREYVENSPSGDEFCVAVMRPGGIQFVVPFTRDRIALQRAIATLTPSGASDPFGVATLREERQTWLEIEERPYEPMLEGGFGGLAEGVLVGPTSSGAQAAARDASRIAEGFEMEQAEQVEIGLMGSLELLAASMVSLNGTKHVVLFGTQGLVPRQWQNSKMVRYQAVGRMHKAFRRAGVILNAIDVSPPRAPGGAQTRGSRDSSGLNYLPNPALYVLTLSTGGTVGTSARDLRARSSVTYLLTFRPRGPQKASNDIKVTVRNQPPLTEVRYRREFRAENEPDAQQMNGLVLADILLNDIPQRGMTVGLEVLAEAEGVALVASIPGDELLANASGKPLSVEVFLYVFDAENLVAGWSHARVAVDAEKGREFLSANAYSVRGAFDLPPGRYVAKALVRLAVNDAVGFQRREFQLP